MKGILYEQFEGSYIPEILQEIYIEKVYDQFFKDKKDMVVVDCGANIGIFSLYAAKYAKKVYAIEPSKEHFETLKKNIEFNKLDKIITPINMAVSHENGAKDFFHNTNKTMFSLNEAVNNTQDKETVEAIRMDTLFDKYDIKGVDFLKLDIEGSEMEVVGGKGFEVATRAIKAIVVEYHKWSGRNPSQLITTLEDYGFDMFHIPAQATLFGGFKK